MEKPQAAEFIERTLLLTRGVDGHLDGSRVLVDFYAGASPRHSRRFILR